MASEGFEITTVDGDSGIIIPPLHGQRQSRIIAGGSKPGESVHTCPLSLGTETPARAAPSDARGVGKPIPDETLIQRLAAAGGDRQSGFHGCGDGAAVSVGPSQPPRGLAARTAGWAASQAKPSRSPRSSSSVPADLTPSQPGRLSSSGADQGRDEGELLPELGYAGSGRMMRAGAAVRGRPSRRRSAASGR
jgi:hypothetical protein